MLIFNTCSFENKQYFNHKNHPSSVSFGYKLPKTPVEDIRNIPHLRCGCCGNLTFNLSEVSGLVERFAAGSKRALESSFLTPFRGTEAFNFLKQLSATAPKVPITKLVSTPENINMIKVLPQNVQLYISKIVLLSESITVNAPGVMKRLTPYYEWYNNYNKETLSTLNIYFQKYPKKSFVEIFNIPDVIIHHSNAYNANKNAEFSQRIAIFKALKNLYPQMSSSEIKSIQKINSTVLEILNNSYYKPHIKKLLIEDLYNSFADTLQDKSLKNEINNLISRIPCGESNIVHSFIYNFVKENKTDMDLVRYFVEELRATFEHIVAKSKKGTDEPSNGIMLCKQCNNERADIPYPQFLKVHPEMKSNLQKQINKVITFIKHGKLIGYDNYPEEVKPVLLNASDNFLKIRIRNLLKYRQQNALTAYENSESEYQHVLQNFDDRVEKLTDLDVKIQKLKSELSAMKKERQIMAKKVNESRESRDYTKTAMETNKIALADAKARLAADEELNKSARYKKSKNI